MRRFIRFAAASKYRAKPTWAYGRRWASKKELAYYQKLLLLKRTGAVLTIELQPSFILQPTFKKNGVTHRAIKYVADFKVLMRDGTLRVIDAKGFLTPMFRLKSKLFEYKYTDLKIEEV